MTLYRFIGELEAYRLLTNETLSNDFDWSTKYDTNSKGICFFANNRTNNIDKIVETALEDWGFGGIVKEFAIVEIEVETARKAWGFYTGGKRTEYNLNEYSLKDVKAIYRIKGKWFDRTTKRVF